MARLTVLIVAVVLAFLAAAPMPGVTAKKYTVGENKFWNPNINYTIWAQDKHFYLGDCLYFVFDRNQHNILEVNQTDYEGCISDHPIRNWTRGAGRDIVTLNQTKHYYLLDGRGGCYGGMKLAVKVEKLPPPPKSAPVKNIGSVSVPTGFAGTKVVLPPTPCTQEDCFFVCRHRDLLPYGCPGVICYCLQ